MATIKRCDTCGKSAKAMPPQFPMPQGWVEIDVSYKRSRPSRFEICGACKKRLGLPDGMDDRDLGQKLLDILKTINYQSIPEALENLHGDDFSEADIRRNIAYADGRMTQLAQRTQEQLPAPTELREE